MSVLETIALFGIMAALAAMPSASVALVVTRSATLGVANGISVAAGIVLGDLVFIILAILGLSIVAETMGALFVVIKHLGAAYLIFLGIALLTSNSKTTVAANKAVEKSDVVAGFLAGFVLTLGDIKAIVFYVSLFPVFLDLSALHVADILVIIFVTVMSVGGVKVVYALSAAKIASMARGLKFGGAVRKSAGGFMIGAGSYIIAKS